MPVSHDIRERAIVVRFRSSVWTGTKKDRNAALDTAHRHGANVDRVKVTKELVSKADLDPIRKIVTSCKSEVHNALTAPWDDMSGRLILADKYQDYVSLMNSYQRDFDNEVSKFCAKYAQLVAQARHDLSGMFDPDDYLPDYQVREKFDWKILVEPVPGSEDFRIDLPNEALRARMRDLDAIIADRVESGARDICGEVQEHLSRLIAAMERFNPDETGKARGSFHDTIIGNLVEIADRLPFRNVAGDPILERARQMIRGSIAPIDPAVLREDPIARRDAAAKARAIATTLSGYATPIVADTADLVA